MIRDPDGFLPPASTRSRKKWERIIGAFEDDRIHDLYTLQRTGTRGRIFANLVKETLGLLGFSYREEPLFNHREPHSWYVAFAAGHGIKLRTHSFYNPDFVLDDGTWVEATLSENAAYRKLFRHGHQAPSLIVVWLDDDTGFHKAVCADKPFPNATVVSISSFYACIREHAGGERLIAKLERLKRLKATVP